jgi:hypothetical protein
LKDQVIVNGLPTKTAVWGNVPVTTSSLGQLALAQNGSNDTATLLLGQNGELQTVEPSIVMEGDLTDDFTSPKIQIISPEPKDYLRSESLNIFATSTDLGTGVSSLNLALDGKPVKTGDTIDLFYEKLGNHRISATSTDLVGNTSATSTAFRIVATTDSTISDVERAYSLGWIKEKKTKTVLIQRIKAIERVEKRIEFVTGRLKNGKTTITRVEKLEKRIDKILARAFQLELQMYQKKKLIDDKAHALIQEDILWLMI